MNKTITSLFVAGTMLTGLGATTAAGASTTPAASLPKIQTSSPSGDGGWHSHAWRIRPGAVYFGGGASFAGPRSRHLHWTHYSQHSARATGQWWQDTCRPNCAKGGYWVSAIFRFYGVFNHSGPGRNFGNAEVRVTSGHAVRGWPTHLWIDSAGDWNWKA